MSTRSDATDGGFWGEADAEVALERYRTLIETIDDGIYQLDADGHLVAVNETLAELTGYARNELHGEHVSVLLDEADVDVIDRELHEYLRADSNEIPPFELSVRTVDGDRVSCELRVTPLVEANEFRGTIGVARPRSGTTRTTVLESARPSSESISTNTAEAGVGVLITDEDFDVGWIDGLIEEYFGLDREAVVGRDIRSVVEETLSERIAEPDSFTDSVLTAYDEDAYIDHLECRVNADADTDLEDHRLDYQSKPITSGRYAGGRIELYADSTDRKRSEDALQESQNAFQSLVDAIEEYAIFKLDADGRVSSWNSGAEQINGYDSEEILGKHFSTFYTEADRAANVPERTLENAIANGSVEEEGRRVRKDGSQFWANVTITPVWDDDDVLRGFLKITRDMSDRRERERELEGELQRVLGRISDAFYAVDDDFRFTHVNERAEELLQRTEAELLGENLWDVFPSAAEIDDVREAFHTARETQESTSYELYYDELDFWVEANLYPSETGISVYFRDVTERKRYERELEESEQRYRTIAEYFPNGIVTLFDHDLEYTLAAGQGFDRIPDEPGDLEGRRFSDIWPSKTSEELEPALLAALEGEQQSVELSYAGREWVVHAAPVTDKRGDVFAGVTMAQDITERTANQRRLEETVAQLENSNKRLEQFAYAASHDLQEPLRMVSSYLQLIESRYADDLDRDGEDFLEYAIDGADRMREMIGGLLEYSRIETRGGPLEPVDLEAVLEDVLSDLQITIEESDAEITSADLPRVVGDAIQLRHVFQNLVSNAITYSGDEPPRIHVDAERRGGEWVISVHDEGIGIEPENQQRVFEVFQRLHSSETYPGSGIGLALCERIVERHGGEIWLESEPGVETMVSFTLPVAHATDE